MEITTKRTGPLTPSTLSVGSAAPDFTLLDQNRVPFHLSEQVTQAETVLYFYTKDFSQGCTKQACGFRDVYKQFSDLGARVVGVSGDTVESHRYFSDRYNLPFTLLADVDGTVRDLYGVQRMLGIVPVRITFVIDRQGIVRHTFHSYLNSMVHIDEALRILNEMSGK